MILQLRRAEREQAHAGTNRLLWGIFEYGHGVRPDNGAVRLDNFRGVAVLLEPGAV